MSDSMSDNMSNNMSNDTHVHTRGRYRIVYVWDADYPWDVRTEKICAALTDAGHDVHIVARNRAWRPLVEKLPEGTVHRMAPWRWAGRRGDKTLGFPAFFSPRWRGLLRRVAREVDADLIIVRDLPLCPTAISIGKSLGIPVIFDMAENYPAMMRLVWEAGRAKPLDHLLRNPAATAAVELYCLPRVAQVLTMVQESSDRLIAMGADPARVHVVSNTPPISRLTQARKHAPDMIRDTLNLVYLGIMEIPRGVTDLLDCMTLLRDDSPRVKLRLIGDGRDMDIFREHARRLQLTERDVEFLGYLPHADALGIVAASDVGVIPLRAHEAYDTTVANKLFDYMAAGLPVLTSDTAPCIRLMAETRAGVVFRSGDANDMARAVRRLMDPALRRAQGEAGRRAIRERYNWEQDVAVLTEVVELAVSSSSARAIEKPVRRSTTDRVLSQ